MDALSPAAVPVRTHLPRQASTGEPACGGAASRFATGACSPAGPAASTSQASGGGSGSGWLHGAVHWVLGHIPSGTLGECGSGLLSLGVALTGSACIVVSYNNKTENLQIGSTETTGVGAGVPSAGFLFGPMDSNAHSINELGGRFAQLGGSGELLNLTVGGDAATGTSPTNRQIVVAQTGAGLSADLPGVEIGWETHGAATYTWTQTWTSFHL
jgi:hypothetical protein